MSRAKNRTPIPTLEQERNLLAQGIRVIAGVDEAGRGSIFGPVCVGMVVLPLTDLTALAEQLKQVRDSKKLRKSKIYRLAGEIKAIARGWGVGAASAQEVDALHIRGAVSQAGYRAWQDLQNRSPLPVEYLLTDSQMRLPELGLNQTGLVRGDEGCLSIACAAILAKTYHDDLVRELAARYPAYYGLATNVGYGTPAHKRAIKAFGPTPDHRQSFKPIREIEQLRLF